MLTLPSTSRVEVCVDEAGRGCLMGDVCAAAVIMPSTYDPDDKLVGQIKDSKKLTAKKRDLLADYIKEKAIAYGIGIASSTEIDEHNILNATHIAMHRALDMAFAKHTFEHILVDGDKFKIYMHPGGDWVHHTTVVEGDNTHLGIAAASILAKTHRDNIVKAWVTEHPDWDEKYGFSTNKGYGTKKHMDGIKEHGVLSIHRRSFAPVGRSSICHKPQ